MRTVVANIRWSHVRQALQCKDPRYVLVDRTTKWGNPFRSRRSGTPWELRQSRLDAIRKYREWIRTGGKALGDRLPLKDQLDQLRGKVLVCWCAPQECHADVLVDLCEANHDNDAAFSIMFANAREGQRYIGAHDGGTSDGDDSHADSEARTSGTFSMFDDI